MGINNLLNVNAARRLVEVPTDDPNFARLHEVDQAHQFRGAAEASVHNHAPERVSACVPQRDHHHRRYRQSPLEFVLGRLHAAREEDQRVL